MSIPGTSSVAHLEENAAVKPIFDAWLEPLKELGARRNVMAKIGNTDHLFILKKPFERIEVLQLAHTLAERRRPRSE